MVRAWYVFRPARGLWLRLPLPFLGFCQGPKLAVEHGDLLPGPGDVYVDYGLRRDPGDDSVLVDELVPFAPETERRPIVRGPLEFDGQVEVDLLGRRGRGEHGRFHVGLDGESPVVVPRELREVRIRRLDRRYPPQPKLGYQPRLKRPPKPFYPALRLGDRGGYQLDPELLAHAFEVYVDVAVDRSVLLGELPELEYGAVVAVKGLRDPVFAQDLPHHFVVALKGFLLLEAEAHHGSGGVVDCPVEGGLRKRFAEPVMDRGVDLEELPEALPPGP